MGFFDSLKGFGAGVLDIFGQGVQAVLPSFIEAGAGALFGSIFPGQQPAGSQVFRRPALGPVQQRPLLLPPGARQPPRLPLDPRFTQQNFPRPLPLPQLPRGTQMPHFPADQFAVTQAGFNPAAGSPFATQALFGLDLPGIDLQLPFTADARTGGTAFFNPVGVRAQSPRSLIMQLNPSTGKPTFFRHAGRPIMFSGDKALCKQMDKLTRRRSRR